MTKRKPPGFNFESWVDKQIREATEQGKFNNLPGSGKPLPGLNHPYNENWWAADFLRRENLPIDAMLPTPLKLLKESETLKEQVKTCRSERQVRKMADELNQRITAWQRTPIGPQVTVPLVDVRALVKQWRADRAAAAKPGLWKKLTSRLFR